MQLTTYRTSANGENKILFPRLECWNSITKLATFAAEVNKRRVLCRISLDILRNKFDASEEEPMRSVNLHRAVIQEAARKLIEKDAYEEDGSILIRIRDL